MTPKDRLRRWLLFFSVIIFAIVLSSPTWHDFLLLIAGITAGIVTHQLWQSFDARYDTNKDKNCDQ